LARASYLLELYMHYCTVSIYMHILHVSTSSLLNKLQYRTGHQLFHSTDWVAGLVKT